MKKFYWIEFSHDSEKVSAAVGEYGGDKQENTLADNEAMKNMGIAAPQTIQEFYNY